MNREKCAGHGYDYADDEQTSHEYDDPVFILQYN
jgi:hypothetical protein